MSATAPPLHAPSRLRRAVVAVVVACAAIATALPAAPAAAQQAGQVLIAEVFNGGSPTQEWVALANVGDQPVDLGGWGLRDYSGSGAPQGAWAFPDGTEIGAASLLVVERTAGGSGAADNDVDAVTGGSFNIAASSDRLDLTGADGTLVDGVAWGSANSVEGFTIPNPGLASGQSLERTAAQDTDQPADWAVATAPEAWTWAPLPDAPTEPPAGAELAQVHHIDVGQGDSAYIELPGDVDVLIDCGWFSETDTVIDYLRAQEVDDIDLLITTHPNADHIGGCAPVMDEFGVERIIDSGLDGPGGGPDAGPVADYQAARARAVAGGATYEAADFQTFDWADADASLEILGPVTANPADANGSSVVAKVTIGEMDFMFTGDMGFASETAVVNRAGQEGIDLDVEFLKVAHHGSKYSTAASWLDAVRPEFGVISVGLNTYGHPTPETLGRLEDADVRVYTTLRDGDVVVTTDGVSADVNGETVLGEELPYEPPPPPEPDPDPEPPTLPTPAGEQVLVNPSFEEPGANGALPTGWAPVYLGAERSPYRLQVAAYGAGHAFAPPEPILDGDYALEVFWQTGDAINQQIGVAAEQRTDQFGTVDQTGDVTLSYAAVQTYRANPDGADWGGGLAEVVLTGPDGQERTLRYFHPNSGRYRGQIDATGTDAVKYVVADAFPADDAWIAASHDLNGDIEALFGLTEFTVQAVRVGNLQQRNTDWPFSGMTTYWDAVSLHTTAPQGPPGGGDGPAPNPTAPVAVGNAHTLARSQTGMPWAWGDNGSGRLGKGAYGDETVPVRVADLGAVVDVSAGETHSLAAAADGTAWAWGSNRWGQLGNGQSGLSESEQSPVQVANLTGVTRVAGGNGRSFALLRNGTIRSWGWAGSALGSGDNVSRLAPGPVGGPTDVLDLSAGPSHTVALEEDGTVWAWGSNSNGALGDGTTETRNVPVTVPGLPPIADVVAGNSFTLALADDGTVWTWGANYSGQLGHGDAGADTRRLTPTRVEGLDDVQAIAAGASHGMALDADDVLWSWGLDGDGQLGNGDTTGNVLTPTAVDAPEGLTGISAGPLSSAATTADGGVWMWGDNSTSSTVAGGHLGDGTREDRAVPTRTLLTLTGDGFAGDEPPEDTTAPVVETFAPEDGATDVAVDAAVSATFDETVTATELDGVTITPDGGAPLAGVTATVEGATLAIAHPPLDAGTAYTVTVPAGAVTDAAGNPAAEAVWGFTTVDDGGGEPGEPTQVLVNPSFEEPGVNGEVPTGWGPGLLDNETGPYNLVIDAFGLDGQYAPPGPIPDGDFAAEVFWQVGSNLGVMGATLQQTADTFGGVDGTGDMTLSYNAVETFYANPASVAWAGAVAEVEVASGGDTYRLRYFHPGSRDYTGAPVDSADGATKYVIADRLVEDQWVAASHDLDADLEAAFGLDGYTVAAVRIGNLQERTADFPFSNMTSYVDDVRLTTDGEVTPPDDDGEPPRDYMPINEVQGPSGFSPLSGQTVTIEGVVTGVDDEIGANYERTFPEDAGVFVQSLPDDVDDDPATSEGVFVGYVRDRGAYPPGTHVRLEGRVVEKFGQTIVSETIDTEPQILGAVAVPEPVEVDVTAAEAQDPAARAYYESLEGMRVRLASGTATSGGTNKFGELFLTPGASDQRTFRTDAAPALIATDADAGAGDPDNPYKPEAPSTTLVRGDLFDRVDDVVGPLGFSYDHFKVMVQPGLLPTVVDGPTAYPFDELAPAADDEFRIASFNAENYFSVGADLDLSPVTQEAYDEKRQRLADAIGDLLHRPDVVAVQEVENLDVLEALADELGGYTAHLIEGNDSRGIDVGYLVAEGVGVANLRQLGDDAPGSCSDVSGGLFDRPPLALDVTVGERTVTVFNNHFSSKAAPDSCREAQAAFLVEQAAAVEAAGGDVIVTGDLNAFEDEGALTTLEAAGLDNLWDTVPEEERYSYHFAGKLQTLDHTLVSGGLADAVVDFRYAHISNDYFERDDTTDGHSLSDHDPMVLTLAVEADGPGACPGSDQRPTVVVGDVDSGVPNHVLDDGCTINDRIDEDGDYRNRGAFMRHVRDVLSELEADGVLEARDRGAITRAAARSDVGGPRR